jgi:hypothetical protein
MLAANPLPTSPHVPNPEEYPLGFDHALFFETSMGYTISFEDIIAGGDADFEDLVINFAPADDSGFMTPVPEPSTVFLIGTGLLEILVIIRKKYGLRKKRE